MWDAPTTTSAQRKEILRQVIQKITVTVEGESEQVQVTIEWSGGSMSHGQIMRPVAKWTQLSNYPQLCQRLGQLAQTNLTTDEIIDQLHQEGFRPPKRRQTFNREGVRVLMRRLGLIARQAPKPPEPLQQNQWWLPELAATLEMPTPTLYDWANEDGLRQDSARNRLNVGLFWQMRPS